MGESRLSSVQFRFRGKWHKNREKKMWKKTASVKNNFVSPSRKGRKRERKKIILPKRAEKGSDGKEKKKNTTVLRFRTISLR